ncbi:MAG TPA: hypothetical protein VJX67_10660 [Blastocatellia bacterium]|nr:hypothetical protein [Blastocatellia bacterium]
MPPSVAGSTKSANGAETPVDQQVNNMGCDINTAIEVRRRAPGPAGGSSTEEWVYVYENLFRSGEEGKLTNEPFQVRLYALFGWLAGVRNYSEVPPLSSPRGLPADASADVNYLLGGDGEMHSHSWFTLKELLDFDYDAQVEDRRVSRQVGPNQWNGGCTCAPGEGGQTTYRKMLGEIYFRDLEIMRARFPEPGDVRILFCFDD